MQWYVFYCNWPTEHLPGCFSLPFHCPSPRQSNGDTTAVSCICSSLIPYLFSKLTLHHLRFKVGSGLLLWVIFLSLSLSLSLFACFFNFSAALFHLVFCCTSWHLNSDIFHHRCSFIACRRYCWQWRLSRNCYFFEDQWLAFRLVSHDRLVAGFIYFKFCQLCVVFFFFL